MIVKLSCIENNIMMTTIYKIGVTGSAGSGKSIVCRRFAELGVPVISSDEIARQVVEPEMPAYKEILDLFGHTAVLENGSINRAMLRTLISRNPGMRKNLEAIVQPAILKELFLQINEVQQNGGKIVAVEVPLLFELGLEDRFDLLITVAADEDVIKKRVAARDGVSESEAGRLLGLQMPQQEKIQKSDIILWNKSSVEELFMHIDKLYFKIKNSFVDMGINIA